MVAFNETSRPTHRAYARQCVGSSSCAPGKNPSLRVDRNEQYSVTALTNASGTIVERYAYTAYGQPTFLDGSGTVLTSSAEDNRYTYTGREWDEVLGLYHYRARMYDAVSGRFASRDPIEQQLVAFYEYTASSPLNYVDWSGNQEERPEDPSDTEVSPMPPGSENWNCFGNIPGPSETYELHINTCCTATIRLSIQLTRCFRPGWFGQTPPGPPNETPEENARRKARNFYTKVSVKSQVLGSFPDGCAETGRDSLNVTEACRVYPGRYISSLGPQWPPDSIPDLENGEVDSGIEEFGSAGCDVVRNHPWGVPGVVE